MVGRGAAVLIALGALSCGGTQIKKDQLIQPVPFEQAVRQAAQVAAEQKALVVRYNPVTCNCPDFEIQLGARWVRLDLEGADVEESAAGKLVIKARADVANGVLRRYPVQGDLSTTPRRCAQGALFLTLSVAAAERSE